jgi:tRNA (guanine37-N1)-methyltransferase
VKIDVATLFPGMFRDVLGTSIVKLARERGVVDVGLYDIRDFTFDRHRTVDDRPYGGGPGMLLMPEPVVLCVERILRERGPGRVVLLTPQGRRFTQELAREYAAEEHLVLVCGRYEGFDERIGQVLSAEELSIGDYVLTGGELAAMVVTDAVVRLRPGALGDESSARSESFSEASESFPEGDALEGPQYTRPAVFRGLAVPEVLLSGDHARVARWREEQSRKKTRLRRSGPERDAEE